MSLLFSPSLSFTGEKTADRKVGGAEPWFPAVGCITVIPPWDEVASGMPPLSCTSAFPCLFLSSAQRFSQSGHLLDVPKLWMIVQHSLLWRGRVDRGNGVMSGLQCGSFLVTGGLLL